MHLGYVTRGQGCRAGDRWGTVQQHAAEVDGEQFVIVRFGGGEEQLVSALELLPATQAVGEVEDKGDGEIEEIVAGEVEEAPTQEIEVRSFERDKEQLEDGEVAEESDDEEAETAEETEK